MRFTIFSTSIIVLSALTGTAPLSAQAPGGWSVGVGVGPGVVLSGHDRQDPGDEVLTVRAEIYPSGDATGWGLEWIGNWMEGAHGGDHRYHLGMTVSQPVPGRNVTVHGGVGLGLVTVTDVDGVPSGPGPAGDLVVATGDYVALGLSAGGATHVRLGGTVRLTPRLDVLLQRGGGRNLALAALTVQLDFGPLWS